MNTEFRMLLNEVGPPHDIHEPRGGENRYEPLRKIAKCAEKISCIFPYICMSSVAYLPHGDLKPAAFVTTAHAGRIRCQENRFGSHFNSCALHNYVPIQSPIVLFSRISHARPELSRPPNSGYSIVTPQ